MAFVNLDNTVRSLSPDLIGYAQVAEVIPAGAVVYLNAAGKLALADATDAIGGDVDGVALADANAANQIIPYAKPGSRLVGLTGLTPGLAYYLAESDALGDPGEVTSDYATDNVTSDSYLSIVLVARTATTADLIGINTGAQIA